MGRCLGSISFQPSTINRIQCIMRHFHNVCIYFMCCYPIFVSGNPYFHRDFIAWHIACIITTCIVLWFCNAFFTDSIHRSTIDIEKSVAKFSCPFCIRSVKIDSMGLIVLHIVCVCSARAHFGRKQSRHLFQQLSNSHRNRFIRKSWKPHVDSGLHGLLWPIFVTSIFVVISFIIPSHLISSYILSPTLRWTNNANNKVAFVASRVVLRWWKKGSDWCFLIYFSIISWN